MKSSFNTARIKTTSLNTIFQNARRFGVVHNARLALAAMLCLAVSCSACDRQVADKAVAGPVAGPATPVVSAASASAAKPDAAALAVAGARARLDAPVEPLSAMALLGRKIFFDKTLSGSGKLSCASCHDPEHAYAPGNDLAVQLGGLSMQHQGGRAVPSLAYHDHAPPFSIGPDNKPDEDDQAALQAAAAARKTVGEVAPRNAKSMEPVAQEMVPQGGFDWDGRAINLTDQASGPLLDPNEMANKDAGELAKKLKASPYAADMTLLFGPGVFTSPSIALGEAYFALARYQIEERSFHPYNSKYDYYLAQKVQLSEQEKRGLDLFKDPKKGNCAACHVEKPSRDGRLGPAFTDYQFEALAAPRSKGIIANGDSKYFDLGMCGPWRKDYAKQLAYCGYFKTPSLRNTATRQVFFHNGTFRSLEDVVRFYVERETRPEKWYPKGKDGKVAKYNDLPAAYHANVDIIDAPFNRKAGEEPALSEQEIKDVVAFLKTLNDGYKPDAGEAKVQ
jgi:cytochrome c peroxidase